jgi:AcrR family transcriptional regulator
VPKVSEEHREARRRQILDAARRAFGRYGYEGATIARLERETGLSRGAIFNYFPNKWKLFFALAQDDEQRALELWRDEGYAAVLHWVSEQPPEWIGVYLEIVRLLRTDEQLAAQWRRRNPELESELREHLAEQQRRGEVRGDVEARDIVQFLALLIDGLVMHRSIGATYDSEPLLKLVVAALAPE